MEENKRITNVTIIKKDRIIVMEIATNLLNFRRINKFTTGLSIIAIMAAKIIGTIMPLPIYRIVVKAIRLIRKIKALIKNGSLNSSLIKFF
jgi:hypothetical protein